MSYRQLEIWQLARDVVISVHRMTFTLPKHEMFETGAQIRRSSKSVRSNIVEGYGRRVYKQEFIRFIIFALSSNDETMDHLDTLYETGSLTNESGYRYLKEMIDKLGRKLNNFLDSVQKQHNKLAENK
ncbi:MAG TPA: four helix bundle protein [Flavipsychrobacter sp.]|nr:four helix bundle protein [Flavipsychrobacter sp.]